jgi:undecaprenyl-phosphate 4-deoxy-4-formamido-L-arabinose transferase
MPSEIKKISVVVPVYNSAHVINDLFNSVDKALSGLGLTYQLVLIDDCSNDNSWEVIKELKNKHREKITAINMARNFSQHNAIFCGFHYATGDLIITLDDDLQNPPDEIPRLLERFKDTDADIVYGVSKEYKRSATRNTMSKGFKATTKMTSEHYTGGSPFRLMKKHLVQKLITHNQQFVFIDELVSWYTKNIQYVLVRHDQSKVGQSRYSAGGLIRLYFNLVFGYNPMLLKLITYLGLSSSFISFLIGVFFIVKKLFFHIRIGFTGIIVSITFTSGIVLLSIGIIGEYLRRMYIILNERPQYSIREILE